MTSFIQIYMYNINFEALLPLKICIFQEINISPTVLLSLNIEIHTHGRSARCPFTNILLLTDSKSQGQIFKLLMEYEQVLFSLFSQIQVPSVVYK